jgi:hypothetical protein
MKPSQVFGIIVRVIGVFAWLGSIWRVIELLHALAYRTATVNGRTITLVGADDLIFAQLLPTIALVIIGFALIRPYWLIGFAYRNDE